MFLTPILMLLVLASDPTSGQITDRTEAQRTAKVPVGKDTTFVTGPLDDDGYIDYRLALNERLAKGVSPEKNASTLLWKAFGPTPEDINLPVDFFKQLGMARPPDRGDYFVMRGRHLKDKYNLEDKQVDAIENQMDRVCKRPWSAHEYPYIASWLVVNEKPLALAIEATQRPLYFNPVLAASAPMISSPLFSAPLVQAQECRELARALTARAMLEVHAGKLDAAWNDLLACHRLGRLVARGAMTGDTVVGIAIDAMSYRPTLAYLDAAKLTAKQLRERLDDLRGLLPWPPFADKVDLGERFSLLDALQFVRRYGKGAGALGLSVPPGPEELRALDRMDWKPGFRNLNRRLDRFVVALRVTDPVERRKQIAKIKANAEVFQNGTAARLRLLLGAMVSTGPAGEMMVCALLPALCKEAGSTDRAEQLQRNEEIAFALALYRVENGRYPAKLDDVVPAYLGSVPGDVFSGKALIYRTQGDRYLLYSIGPNGKDDDGRSFDDQPRGDDIAVRMPLPPLRK
jgi:hypothetical protein